MSEALVSAAISGASGIFGAIAGGFLAAWGAIKAVERNSRDLEATEIRRQKIGCIVALHGLRWVISQGMNPPDEYKAMLNYEMNKVTALWADDPEVMNNLRDFYAQNNNERFILLLRNLGNTTKLPTHKLADADIRSIFQMMMSGH